MLFPFIRYVGPHATKPSSKLRYGVQLDKAVGRNAGTIKGHAYFSCPPKCGVLVLRSKIRPSTGAVGEEFWMPAPGMEGGGAGADGDRPRRSSTDPTSGGGGGIMYWKNLPSRNASQSSLASSASGTSSSSSKGMSQHRNPTSHQHTSYSTHTHRNNRNPPYNHGASDSEEVPSPSPLTPPLLAMNLSHLLALPGGGFVPRSPGSPLYPGGRSSSSTRHSEATSSISQSSSPSGGGGGRGWRDADRRGSTPAPSDSGINTSTSTITSSSTNASGSSNIGTITTPRSGGGDDAAYISANRHVDNRPIVTELDLDMFLLGATDGTVSAAAASAKDAATKTLTYEFGVDAAGEGGEDGNGSKGIGAGANANSKNNNNNNDDDGDADDGNVTDIDQFIDQLDLDAGLDLDELTATSTSTRTRTSTTQRQKQTQTQNQKQAQAQKCALPPLFSFRPGDRVMVHGYGPGTVLFFGSHATKSGGQMRCGVSLDDAIGLNNGSVDGHRYFTCSNNHGVLVVASKVWLLEDVAAEDNLDSDVPPSPSAYTRPVAQETLVLLEAERRSALKAEKAAQKDVKRHAATAAAARAERLQAKKAVAAAREMREQAERKASAFSFEVQQSTGIQIWSEDGARSPTRRRASVGSRLQPPFKSSPLKDGNRASSASMTEADYNIISDYVDVTPSLPSQPVSVGAVGGPGADAGAGGSNAHGIQSVLRSRSLSAIEDDVVLHSLDSPVTAYLAVADAPTPSSANIALNDPASYSMASRDAALPELPAKALKIFGQLGSGATFEVYAGLYQHQENTAGSSTNTPLLPLRRQVAVRIPRSDGPANLQETMLHEARILAQLKHPNVAALLGVVRVGKVVQMVMQLYDRGSLHRLLASGTLLPSSAPLNMSDSGLPILPESAMLRVARDIVAGMRFLSSERIIHRYLASSNIMVGMDNSCTVCDLSMARVLQEDQACWRADRSEEFPLRWSPPEVLIDAQFSFASDAWSFGVLMVEVLTHAQRPFSDSTDDDVASILAAVAQTGDSAGMEALPRPSNAPSWAYDNIILPCWRAKAADRISFDELTLLVDEQMANLPAPTAVQAGYGQAIGRAGSRRSEGAPVDFHAELARLRTSGDLEEIQERARLDGSCIPREIPRPYIGLVGQIGRGQFGEVWKAALSEQVGVVQTVACKCAYGIESGETPVSLTDFVREAIVMASIPRHDNVISLIGVATIGTPLMLVQLYCEHGSLLEFLRGRASKHTPVAATRKLPMALDIAKGVAHLHQNHIVHRDLAARNVLVDSDYVCKVADFGLSRTTRAPSQRSRRRSEDEYYRSRQGVFPIRWTAPEAMETWVFTGATDTWSFAVVLVELYTDGARPYDGMKLDAVQDAVARGYRAPCPPDCPRKLYQDVMLECWAQDPESRPSFGALVTKIDALQRGSVGSGYAHPKPAAAANTQGAVADGVAGNSGGGAGGGGGGGRGSNANGSSGARPGTVEYGGVVLRSRIAQERVQALANGVNRHSQVSVASLDELSF